MSSRIVEFSLDDDQTIKLIEWEFEHTKTCSMYDNGTQVSPPCGAIGGRLSYTFNPTGLGVITTVKCACGEKLDLTDYDCW